MNLFTSRPSRRTVRIFMATCWIQLCLCVPGSSLAAPDELGRLFYTPAQRAQLETARANNVTQHAIRNRQGTFAGAPAPLHYDGVVIRSDGTTTRWVDGKAETGASTVKGLKPGQIRADGKVYEPYQVLRPVAPSPAVPDEKESEP